jgi:hypothetical protein
LEVESQEAQSAWIGMKPSLTPSDRLLYTYCGTDCCVTLECAEAMSRKLLPNQRKHYEFFVRTSIPLLYMELRGMRYDYEKAKSKLNRVQRHVWRLQDIVNRAAAAAGWEEVGQVYRCLAVGNARQRTSKEGVEEGSGIPKSLHVSNAASMGRSGVNEIADYIPLGEGEAALVPLISQRLCQKKPRRREEVTTTRTFKNGKTKITTKMVSKPVEIRTLADCEEFVLASRKDDLSAVLEVLGDCNNRVKKCAQLSELLGLHVKINSTGNSGEAVRFLYEACGFTPHYQKEGNRLTDRLSSDDETLIKIWVEEQKSPKPWVKGGVRLRHRGRLALAFLKLRRLVTKTKTLRVAPDEDSRMRCGYNLTKKKSKKSGLDESGGPTKTGRLACYESPTGHGYNLQTVTKKDRDLFLADEGCLMFQRDLAGADGWTVAAFAAAQGDATMLEDYQAGIKPAKVGVLMWQKGPQINNLPREELKALCKEVDGDSWEYFGFKRVQHGSSYLMGDITMSNQILTDSFKLTGKPVFIPPGTCKQMQQGCFFTRYWGIPRWHQWMAQHLQSDGCLIASNGFKRLFFGRKDDHSTLKDALAHLPQVYTTHATLMALDRMWTDPDNRQMDGSLRCEPLHTVHDSLLTQAKEELREWVDDKLVEWFNNPMLIAASMITIPADGGCGRDWKNLS